MSSFTDLCSGPDTECGPGSDPSEPQSAVDAVLAALQLRRDKYPHLTDGQFECLHALLFEFREIFSVDVSSFGCVAEEKQFYHRIRW